MYKVLVTPHHNGHRKAPTKGLRYVRNSGQFCWASRVHQVLYKFGFGFVWENQRVQNPEAFIMIFMQRFVDCHSQNWHEHVSNSTRFSIYRMFKTSVSLEPYFTSVANKHISDILIKFGIGPSYIRVHRMRYVAHTPQDLLCPLCNTAYEDEMQCISYFIANH